LFLAVGQNNYISKNLKLSAGIWWDSDLPNVGKMSVVVHFQGKAFNCGCFLVDVGRGPTVQLKLGRINHDRMKKWVKTMYVPESTYHRDTFPPQNEADTTKFCL
jgi:hypothetical protein